MLAQNGVDMNIILCCYLGMFLTVAFYGNENMILEFTFELLDVSIGSDRDSQTEQ